MTPNERLPYGGSVVDELVMPGKFLGRYQIDRWLHLTLLGAFRHAWQRARVGAGPFCGPLAGGGHLTSPLRRSSLNQPRVVRGGSWAELAHRSRSAARDKLSPESRDSAQGFRIVLAPER